MMERIKFLHTLGSLSLLLAFSQSLVAQTTDSVKFKNNTKKNSIIIGGAAAYSISMIGLNEVWYKNSPRESFHFFNDSKEWNQLDKAGHFFSSFQLSNLASNTFQWSGINQQKALLAGSVTSFVVVSSIELFDGFSSAYGASVYDIAANAAGSSFFLGQQLLWKQTRIYPKISFHRTGFATRRPDVLGKNMTEQIIKDYNGQTYWLSVDMDKFVNFPKWLNIAIGYGAEDMIYATNSSNQSIGLNPYRQYYLGIDFDLTAFKSKSKLLNALIYVANMIKIPAPALEFSKKGTKIHSFYF